MLTTDTCVHHYDLDRDMLGTCRICGATRQYPQPWLPEPQLTRKAKRTSQYRGVRLGRDGWRAVWSRGRNQGSEMITIGVFETEREAARAYNEYAVRNGTWPQLNVIEEK